MPDQIIHGNYVAVPDRTLKSKVWKELQPSTRCVFWVMLLRYKRPSTRVEWSIEELVPESGICKRTVRSAIAELRASGFLYITKKGGRWQGRSVYELNPLYLDDDNQTATQPQVGELFLPVGEGRIYFVGNVDKAIVKIGYSSKDVDERLNSLQTGCPYELSILKIIEQGSPQGEVTVQRWFADYHLRGEWFTIAGELANYLVPL